MRQIATAMMMRAMDHRDGCYCPATNSGGNSLGFFFPRYIRDPGVAVCPATENIVRPANVKATTADAEHEYDAFAKDVPYDVVSSALTKVGFGMSYEPYGWYSKGVFPNGRIVDGRKVGTYLSQLGLSTSPGDARYKLVYPTAGGTATAGYLSGSPYYYIDVVKRIGKLYGSTDKTILLCDNDSDQYAANKLPMNNWPDANNNHGNVGCNFAFADGHVQFIRRGPEIITTFLDGYQDPAMHKDFISNVIPTLTVGSQTVDGVAMNSFTYAK